MEEHPLHRLSDWIADARERGLAEPASAAFVTATPDGRPSARTVTIKRVDPAVGIVLTSALWTRKVRELHANPAVALLLHWPSLGRQVHVSATARLGPAAEADTLFAERDAMHRWQTLVSRQGEVIDDLGPLRDRLRRLLDEHDEPPARPSDWGALHLAPTAIEFWTAAADRLHDRCQFTLEPGGGWSVARLAP